LDATEHDDGLGESLFAEPSAEARAASKVAGPPDSEGDPYQAIPLAFRSAADRLVDHFGDPYSNDWFLHFFPIWFLYRHAIEMQIKRLIRECLWITGTSLSGRMKKLLRSHELLKLWDRAVSLMNKVDADSLDAARLGQMRMRISEIYDVDPKSTAARYEPDRLPADWQVDLLRLKNVAGWLLDEIGGHVDWADSYAEMKREMREMEAEFMQEYMGW